MIPKIIDGRRDKASSFKQLINYMTDKPSDSLTDTVQPTNETVSAVAPGTFDGLNDYLVRHQKTITEPVEVEPGTQRVNIGDVTCQYNTFTLDGGAQEMNAVALQNTRTRDPVIHYVLSWPDYEKPNDDAVFDSVKFTLTAMGMDGHQYVAAIHRDTDNLHVHVAVNRINPETYKAASQSFSKDTLHKACRILEMKNGWTHSNGAYIVNEQQQVVRNPDSHKERSNWKSKDAINKMENKDGTETLYRYILGDEKEAGSRQNYLHITSGLRDAKNWGDVHQAFSDVGLRLEKAVEHKGYVITHEGEHGTTAVKASLIFNRAQYTLKSMEERFGRYEASTHKPANVSIYGDVYHPRAYRRDSGKRLQRKIQRAEERLLLKGRYKAYRNNLPRFEMEREYIGDKFRMANKHTRLVKANIRSTIRDPQLRRLMYNLAEFQKQQAIARLRLNMGEQRDGFKAANPRLSYRQWVEQEALKGDKAALSQMRGFAYAERRKQNYKSQLVNDIGFDRMFNGITSQDRDDVPVMVSERHGVKPRLLKDGTIILHRNGHPVTADRGHIILTESVDSGDERAADLGVALALAGKAGEVRFDGDGTFKEMGIQRIVNAAEIHDHPVAKNMMFVDTAQQEYARAEQQRLRAEQNDSKNEMEMKNRVNGQFKPQ